MTVETKVHQVPPGITVFSIIGRLNMGEALIGVEAEIHKLIADGARKLVMDLSGLTHMDSSAIGMLMGTSGVIEDAGGKLRLAGATGSVAKSFKIVHLDQVVAVHDDVESACQAFAD